MSRLSTKQNVKILVPTKSKKKSERSCNVCHKLFKIKKDMLEHICEDTEKLPYVCEQCGNRFKSRYRLKCHISSVHKACEEEGGSDKLSCLLCGKHFKALCYLKVHQASHEPKKFVCEAEGCGKKYFQLNHLHQHYLAHVNYKPFRCKLCGKTFKLLQFLKRHSEVHQRNTTFAPISEVNTRQGEDSDDPDSDDDLPERLIRVFTCDVCNMHFTRSANLKRHMGTHNRFFPCKVCDPKVKFKSVVERQEHYDSVHSGKPFSCQVCEYKSESIGNLNRHMKRHDPAFNLKSESPPIVWAIEGI